jgi:hypothetical protein
MPTDSCTTAAQSFFPIDTATSTVTSQISLTRLTITCITLNGSCTLNHPRSFPTAISAADAAITTLQHPVTQKHTTGA